MPEFDVFEFNAELPEMEQPEIVESWDKVKTEMHVHTRGTLPVDLITRRRPNEDPEVQQYRLDVYEPITKGSMNKAIDKLYRLFQNANYSIKISEPLLEYLSDTKFDGQYFYSYIQKKVVRRMLEDPNGVLVWLPYGDGMVDSTVQVEVFPELIDSCDVWLHTDEAFVWGNKEKGFYTLTETHYYWHKPDKDSDTFTVYELYQHEIGAVPAITLGGDEADEGFFESFFSAFLPFANEAIRQYSDWVGIMTMSGFPYREEVAETCEYKGCRDGYIHFYLNDDEDGDGQYRKCPSCQGTGLKVNRSPYGAFLRAKGDNVLEEGNSDPLIRFISPPVDIIKYSGEAWQKLLEMAEDALHLVFTKEAQSGKAKEVDREDSYSMLVKISNNVFDELIYKSLWYLESYRTVNPAQREEPDVVKPIDFTIKSESDLLEEINQLTDKNAPVAFLVETSKDLAKKRFSGNKSISRMIEILVSYDPIFHVSTKDKQVLQAAGSISKGEIVKSIYAYKTLVSLVSVNGTEYLQNDLTKIFDDLDAAIAPKIEELENNAAVKLPENAE